jgi:hypothetical protein
MHVTAAFYRGKERASSRFLAWWARSDFSHCELLLSRRGEWFECASSSMMDGGVRVKWIKLNPDHWELFDVPANPDAVRAWAQAAGELQHAEPQALALAMVREWFAEHDREPYDLPGLLGFVVRRIKGWLRAWWCSEACTAALGWVDSWRFDVAGFLAVARTIGRPHRGAFALE